MNMDDSINYGMSDDEQDLNELDDEEGSDLQQTQSTQQASQQPPVASVDSHLWGYLQPCNTGLTRIDFWKMTPRYTFGRNTESNQVVFPGFKISNKHCAIGWDGHDAIDSSVVVEDMSSNGTFINSEKIGRGNSRIIREGNEIAFGTCIPLPPDSGLEDYRFIYRHTAGGQPSEGLFAHYDLATELGKGSFASVRKAVHRATGKWFAVKMIYPSKSVGQQQSRNQTLIREISIMEKLDHRNICKLVEVFFQNDNSINLVLELIEGGDLLDYIMKHSGLSEIDARDITYQICDALAYLHSRGVAHRDLKPENVLLTNHRPPVVKVADFGLAKVVDSATMLRTMCGTPSYLAPEVVNQQDDEGYDNLVDSWSVGVIVFAMVANSSPFLEDEGCKSVKERILRRRIVWEPLYEKGITREGYSFIHSLLQVDPNLRLSMTDSLSHTWLREHTPFHPPDFDEELMGRTDSAMSMSVSYQAFAEGEDVFGREVPAAPISPGRLQRRKDIIAQADDGKIVLPEPSSEMVANVVRQSPAGSSRGQNKRVRAELSTLPEDSLEDVYNAADAARHNAAPPDAFPSVDTSSPDEHESGHGGRRPGRRAKVARRG